MLVIWHFLGQTLHTSLRMCSTLLFKPMPSTCMWKWATSWLTPMVAMRVLTDSAVAYEIHLGLGFSMCSDALK